jgi:hypothetical protein
LPAASRRFNDDSKDRVEKWAAIELIKHLESSGSKKRLKGKVAFWLLGTSGSLKNNFWSEWVTNSTTEDAVILRGPSSEYLCPMES